MKITYRESKLQTAIASGRPIPPYGADVTKELRFVIGVMYAAPCVETLKALRFLKVRSVKGLGKFVLELTRDAELQFSISSDQPPVVSVDNLRKARRRAVA